MVTSPYKESKQTLLALFAFASVTNSRYFFDGKTTAQSSVFCSVTDHADMLRVATNAILFATMY